MAKAVTFAALPVFNLLKPKIPEEETMTDPSAPTLQNATLVKFARAALTRQGDTQEVPWEDFDLSDPQQRVRATWRSFSN